MPFTTPIKLSIPMREGDPWITLEPLHFWSEKFQKHYVVPKDFITDLATVPRLPFVFWWAGRRGDAAAVVHDWLYEFGIKFRQIHDRLEADELYLEILLDTGVPWACAYPMYLGVRAGGDSHFDVPDRKKKLRNA